MLGITTRVIKNSHPYTHYPKSISGFFLQHNTLFSPRYFSSERNLHALIIAVKEKNYDYMQKLANEKPIFSTQQTQDDHSPYHESAKNGDIKALKIIKELFPTLGINYRCHCKDMRTPLHYAAEKGHLNWIQEAIKMAANPNITDEQGRTALDHALENGHDKTAAYIYAKGGRACTMEAALKSRLPKLNTDVNIFKIVPEITYKEEIFQELINNLDLNNTYKKP